MDINNTKELLTFYKQNSKLNEEILELFGPLPALLLTNIMNHTSLFDVYKKTNCKKFANILDAVDSITSESVLVYFAELDLYGTFEDVNSYVSCKNFDSKLSVIICDGNQFGFIASSEKMNHLIRHILTDSVTPYTKDGFRKTIERIHSISQMDSIMKQAVDKIDRMGKLLAVSKKPQVYFIVEEPFQNRVKIGKSYDCEKRLKQLQTGSATKLSIYHTVTTLDNTALEKLLHTKYKDRHLQGEWFRFSRKDLGREIDELDNQ